MSEDRLEAIGARLQARVENPNDWDDIEWLVAEVRRLREEVVPDAKLGHFIEGLKVLGEEKRRWSARCPNCDEQWSHHDWANDCEGEQTTCMQKPDWYESIRVGVRDEPESSERKRA